MAEPDPRVSARRHTAQLLKMLRGYDPTAEPAPSAGSGTVAATETRPAAVAETTTAYARLVEVAPNRRLPPSAIAADIQPPMSPRQHVGQGSIASVGEALRRQPGTLGELMARADRLVRLGRIFRAYLPPHLHDHAVLIQLDQEGWIVHTDSSSWATRLRYTLHSIRQALGQQLGIPLPKPRIQVVPAALPSPSRRPRLTLTARNAGLLEAAARNLSDARLSAALQRLAAHVGPAREPEETGRR